MRWGTHPEDDGSRTVTWNAANTNAQSKVTVWVIRESFHSPGLWPPSPQGRGVRGGGETLTTPTAFALVPNPWNGSLTGGTSAIPQPVLSDTKTVTFNEKSVAAGTRRILPSADVTREIPRIHVAKTGRSTDLGGTNQSRDGRVLRIGHPVVFVEGSHMPGNVRRNASEKSSDVTELFFRVVEARNG